MKTLKQTLETVVDFDSQSQPEEQEESLVLRGSEALFLAAPRENALRFVEEGYLDRE